jgi:hypothetical protein
MAYNFVFGETPAQAAQMGNARAEANRSAQIAAQENTARYAFQAGEMANRNEMAMAQMYNQRQLQENALASEADSIARQGLASDKSAEWQKYQFGEAMKADKARFDYAKERDISKDGTVQNAGKAFASTLGQIRGDMASANSAFEKAKAAVSNLFTTASRKDQTTNISPFDPVTNKWNPTPETALLQSKLAKYQDALDAANQAVKSKTTEMTRAANQATSSGFVIDENGVVHRDTGADFRYTAPPLPPAAAAGGPPVTRFGPDGNPIGGPPVAPVNPPVAPPPAPPRPVAPTPVPPPPAQPPQSTGILPWTARMATEGAKLNYNIPRWVANTASELAPQVYQSGKNITRGTKDIFYTPAVGSSEYIKMMRERELQDAALPRYLLPPLPYAR